MVGKNKEGGVPIHEQLNALEKKGRIPADNRGIVQQKRFQWNEHPSGVHYATPDTDIGRYNDPTGRTGVCYTADHAVTAIAESLGRVYQKDPADFTLGMSELDKAQIYTLETSRETTVINMSKLQGLLHITADKTMGSDQSITQAVTDWAANTPGLNYDGISYPSRHYEGTCTAFWKRDGVADPLSDVSRSSVNSYVDAESANFPSNWDDPDITGFEIVTETLQFSVRPED